ncbi:fibronectin type III domain-containing protein [Kutzneria sp. CA-103260]|uniref:fibronectin type III domain-containing protein n=1 Tax=Kutzneria sp. CA-103260 TaxID=2802641 RepID=UPI001BA7488C|nr:fibronectin type III domain-containing protein [Kutzneria sp. CA-103260]QUQ67175.1 Fibronectin type III domain protein [Kutzneria sp. CA-103260]
MESLSSKRAAWLRFGAVAAGCLVLVGLAVTSQASLPNGLQFIQVGHWVYNTSSQSAVHVDGATGQVDAQASVPGAGAGSQVTQGDRAGYVVDRSRITQFSKSTLGVESSSTPPATEQPVVLEVPGGPYLVYRNAGQIARLGDPAATVPAGGPLSAPVTTSDGTVWLHRIDNGSICDLPRGATLLTCPAQLPQGHDGSLAVVGDRPVVLDTTAGTLSSVGKNGLGDAADIGLALPATVQVANNDVDGRLAVVDPGQNQLHLIDAAGLLRNGPAVRPVSVDLSKDSKYSGPVATSHTVALVDQVRNVVLTYDSKGTLKGTKPIPGADGQTRLALGQDNRIYADNHDGSHVVVVDGRNGSAADVNVDDKARNQSTNGSGPGSATGPNPGPAQQVQAPVANATPPGAPRNVDATAGVGSATVMWSGAPDNGAGITRYLVSWSGGSTTVDGSRSSATVTGLANGRSYVFTVVAENSAGRGAGASSRTVVPGGAADAPRVTATVGSGGQVSVSWTTPNLHGADLDHYLVSASGLGDRSVSSTSTSYQGLSGAITFTVRAVTSYGSGSTYTGSPGTARATLAAGPPTLKITGVRSAAGLVVTVDANANGGPATCQATFMTASSSWVACSGTTEITIPNVFWFGAVTVTATIKNSAGTGTDSWTGTPST